MTDKSKHQANSRIVVLPSPDFFSTGTESWRQWHVRPKLQPLSFLEVDPEKGIGKRIAFCRAQMDNLSVEALSRYIKNFDNDGISRTTIVRYESGENTPGAREIRILCDALWVPADWLLFGEASSLEKSEDEELLDRLIQKRLVRYGQLNIDPDMGDIAKRNEHAIIQQRQKWMDEARKPSKK